MKLFTKKNKKIFKHLKSEFKKSVLEWERDKIRAKVVYLINEDVYVLKRLGSNSLYPYLAINYKIRLLLGKTPFVKKPSVCIMGLFNIANLLLEGKDNSLENSKFFKIECYFEAWGHNYKVNLYKDEKTIKEEILDHMIWDANGEFLL